MTCDMHATFAGPGAGVARVRAHARGKLRPFNHGYLDKMNVNSARPAPRPARAQYRLRLIRLRSIAIALPKVVRQCRTFH